MIIRYVERCPGEPLYVDGKKQAKGRGTTCSTAKAFRWGINGVAVALLTYTIPSLDNVQGCKSLYGMTAVVLQNVIANKSTRTVSLVWNKPCKYLLQMW